MNNDNRVTPTITMAYDRVGNLVNAINGISQFDYTYDAAGRRKSIAKSGSAFGNLSGSIDSYTYNARSELTSARRTKNGQPIPGFSEDTVTVNENPTFRLGSYYFGSDLFDNSTAGGLATLETYATLNQFATNGEEALFGIIPQVVACNIRG